MTLLRWLTFQLGSYDNSESCSSTLLELFLSSDASISSPMAFSPLVNSDHIVVSVSIDFPSNLKRDAPFIHIAYDYSCVDWDSLYEHLRDVPWQDIFKLGASAAACEICEWVKNVGQRSTAKTYHPVSLLSMVNKVFENL